MNKKTILSILVALMLCFTTVIPAAAAPAFATDDNSVAVESQNASEDVPAAETDEEKPLPAMAVADGVVAGEGKYIMEKNTTLDDDDSWTYQLNTSRACMLYFYVDTNEYSADFNITVKNNDTGSVVYDEDNYVDEEYYFEDAIGLDPGNYTISFTNTDWVYNHYYLDVYYEPLHTADDPYYHIEFPEGNVYDNLVYTGKTLQLKAAVLPEPATYETVVWSSADPAIATVDQNGLVKGISKGMTIITANIDGHICTTEMYVEAPTYKINTTAVSLYAKQTKQLKITVDPANYGLSGLTWKSSNTNVATVNSKGLVTAKAKGTATITATVNGVTKTCKVTVKPISLNKTTATVYVKKTQQLKVNGGTGTTTWKSNNKKVATVTSKGVVKGIKPGTATITAIKNGKVMKCKVTVKWEPETGKTTTMTYNVSYDKDFDVNMVGPGKIALTITNTDSGDYADNLDVSVYNPKFNEIIDVSVAPGKTRTVSVNTTARGEFSVYCYGYGKVVLKKTTKPSLSKSTMKVGKGYTGTLKVYGVKNGGKWSSSNKKIATVSSKGVVKGKKKGTCYIKYTLKTGKVIKCKVTVVNPVTCKVTYVDDTSIYNECGVKFTNHTNKKIVYMTLNISQRDGRGYRVKNYYDYDWFYVDDVLPANSSDEWEFWVSDAATRCTAYITKVWFADGTTWTP